MNATGSPNKGLPIVGNSKPTIQIGCEPKYKSSPLSIFWVSTIGTICGNLLHSYGSTKTHTGEMSESQARSYAESGSKRSFRESNWGERRQKRCEDREYEQEEGQLSLKEGSFQMYRTVFGASEHNRSNRRDEERERRDKELKRLHKLVSNLELEARGRHWRRC